MPILDISAGRGALANVNHAVTNLQNANAQRSANFANAFHTFGNALQKHAMLNSQLEMENTKKDALKEEIENKKAHRSLLDLNAQKAKKDLKYYDENHALNKKSVLSNINANNARSANIAEDTKEKRRFSKWLENNFDEPRVNNAMIDFAAHLKR